MQKLLPFDARAPARATAKKVCDSADSQGGYAQFIGKGVATRKVMMRVARLLPAEWEADVYGHSTFEKTQAAGSSLMREFGTILVVRRQGVVPTWARFSGWQRPL